MDPLIIRNSRSKAIQLLLAGVALLIVAVWLLRLEGILTPLMALGGLFLILGALWQLVNTKPQLVLDDRGISGRLIPPGLLPWDTVINAEAKKLGRVDHVCIEWIRPGKEKAETLPILAEPLELSVHQIVEHIRTRARNQGGRSEQVT